MLYYFFKDQVLLRAFFAMIFSFAIIVISGPSFIAILKQMQKKGQPIRDDGPETHLAKSGTPTMGGIMIIFGMLVTQLLFINISNQFIQISWFVFLSFALMGFYDDYLKITKQTSKGLRGKLKMVIQILVSLIALCWISSQDDIGEFTYLQAPYLKDFIIDFGLFYFIFGVIVITGSSNAVNLTDGLDGLVSMPIIFSSLGLGIITYIVSNPETSSLYSLFYIENSSEIMILLAALIGSVFGFLWFNSHPASIFMGDVGSLSIGGLLGIISVILKNEILFAIIGGIFVIEALSVIIQVYYFKYTRGKRIFKMAPIHHHYEKLGLPETKIVVRFWIISFMFLCLGLMSLYFGT
jgi:phospho-N-acetylmuramoyl-pentapeptide-transferase